MAPLSSRPWLLAAVLSVVGVAFRELGPDWPAQEFRAQLARRVGLTLWDSQWYGGHPLAGYSLLYPLVAAVLGAALTGAVAAVGCSWLTSRLVTPDDPGRRWCNAGAAVCLGSSLFLGQVPFLLGLFFGLAAVLVARSSASRAGWVAVVLLAGASSLASPLAGFFLLMLGLAWAFDVGWRRSLPFAAAGAGSVVSLVAGGSSGTFPFPLNGLIDLVLFVVVTLVLVPRRNRLLRRFVVVYAVTGLVSFVVPNPVGGNVTRLAQLFAAPAALWLLSHRRARWVVALVVLPAAFWQLYPVAAAAAHAGNDPSTASSYYDGLLRFLTTRDPRDGRLEIPFTREHWEAALVAPSFPLARGWERQTDYEYDAVLYDPLTPESYRAWLDSAGVDLVALPDAPLDPGGQAEAALLATPPPYLVPVWHDDHWRVWRVEGARPLASGAALTSLTTSSFSLDFTTPGEAVVRVRDSRLWEVTEGSACLVSPPAPDGWVHVRSRAPGAVVVRARLTLRDLISGNQSCS